jgi:hypothetical protein
MLPNFIVVGAAKAGTTALYWYLLEHPSVVRSPVKENNAVASGRDAGGKLGYGDPEVQDFPLKSLDDYQGLFAEAGDATAVGEASPIYLECPQAAARIQALLPGVRIIASLRHPVDRAYSDYLMHLRHRGRRFDAERDLSAAADWARPDSHWMRIGRYHEQLSRYFEAFPRRQIHVSLFDDLKRSPPELMRGVYRFVGVDEEFMPDFTTPHAIGGMPASRLVEGFLTSRAARMTIKPLIPTRAANWVKRLRARNMRKAPSLPADLKRELTGHFRDDIARTGELIGRSLDHWL